MMWKKTVLLFCIGVSSLILLDPYAAPFIMTSSAVFLFFPEYKKAQKKTRMKKDAPVVMYHFSVLSTFLPFEKTLKEACKRKGEFSRELAKVVRRIERGESVSRALEKMKEDNPWSEKEVRLLKACYEKGDRVSEVIKDAAENALEDSRLEGEKNASILVEKYTLLIASGLLIPGLLGMTFSTVSSLDITGLRGMGMGQQEKMIMKQALLEANQLYIPILAVLVSIFLAGAEKERILVYSSVLVPLSLSVFRISLTARLL